MAMAMFGKAAPAATAGPPRSFGDVLSIIGATLKDASPGSEGNALTGVQQLMAGRQQLARQQSFADGLSNLLQPQYQDGPAPTVNAPGLIGGQATSAAAAPVDDPTSAISAATSGMAPGPAPAPAATPAPYTYQAPTRTSNGLTMNDPRMAQIAIAAQAAGYPLDNVLKVLTAQQPSVHFDRGYGYDEKSGAPVGGYHAELDKGQAPVFGPNGQISGVQNLPGAVSSAADMAGAVQQAQEGAKAAFVYPNAKAQSAGSAEGSSPYDFIKIPGPNGQDITIAKSRAVGGAFAGPTPADTTYATDNAKAASTGYQAMQTAGLKAPVLIAKYQRLGQLLDGVDGGKLSPAGMEAASLANSIGLKIDPNLPNKEAANQITNELALSLRDPSNGGGMPGAMSDADRNFLIKSVPNLAQTSQGRKMMVDAQVKVLQRQQDVAGKARQWQQRFGRIDAPDATGKSFQDYLDGYAAAHPLFAQQ